MSETEVPSEDWPPDARPDAVTRLEELLQQWRADIDEVILQLDLAGKDVRDDLNRRLAESENAALAARSRLGDAKVDLVETMAGQWHGILQTLHDVRLAFTSAKEAIERERRD